MRGPEHYEVWANNVRIVHTLRSFSSSVTELKSITCAAWVNNMHWIRIDPFRVAYLNILVQNI